MAKAVSLLEAINNLEYGTTPTPAAKKVNRHVVVALNHLNTRREALLATRAKLNKEIEELDAAILALG